MASATTQRGRTTPLPTKIRLHNPPRPANLHTVEHIEVKTRKLGKKRKGLLDIIPWLGLLVAFSLFALPVVEDAYKQWAYQQVISENSGYDWEDPAYQEMARQAELYNKMVANRLPDDVSSGDVLPYEQQLNYGANGMMGWVEIATLSLKLPIYHGSSTESLVMGVGHMEGTSLPIGGDHTKCALSGHTGMNNERMFDSLGDLEEGDAIVVHSLGREIRYAVTSKEIVLPDAVGKLKVDCEDSQLVLITCYPRGVNSHRLLVHATQVGEGVGGDNDLLRAIQNYLMSPTVVALTVFLILLLLFLLFLLPRRRKKRWSVKTVDNVAANEIDETLFPKRSKDEDLDVFSWT